MKHLWALMLALGFAGCLWAEEAPAGSIDFIYLNQDKFVFGRPAMAEQLSMQGAAALIGLHLESANYSVAVAINTNTFSADKVSVIRNMLTPWLLNLGAREVYFRSSVTGEAIGAPVKTEKTANVNNNIVRQPAAAASPQKPSAASSPAPVSHPAPERPSATQPTVPAPVAEPDAVIAVPDTGSIKLQPLSPVAPEDDAPTPPAAMQPMVPSPATHTETAPAPQKKNAPADVLLLEDASALPPLTAPDAQPAVADEPVKTTPAK